ncbi:MAG: hypothetical protein J5830_06070, partial [Clostridia bacterium]|nr:hypothetical protein [Clostridia bacterium]
CDRIFGEPAGGYTFIDALMSGRPAGGAPAAQNSAAFVPSELRVGTRVRHSDLGTGTVISSKPAFGDVLITIRLDGGRTVTATARPLIDEGKLILLGSARKDN